MSESLILFGSPDECYLFTGELPADGRPYEMVHVTEKSYTYREADFIVEKWEKSSKSQMKRIAVLEGKEMSEPREWYLNPVAKYKCDVNQDGIGLSGNEIHVIEKSAYDALKSQLADYERALEDAAAQYRRERIVAVLAKYKGE